MVDNDMMVFGVAIVVAFVIAGLIAKALYSRTFVNALDTLFETLHYRLQLSKRYNEDEHKQRSEMRGA